MRPGIRHNAIPMKPDPMPVSPPRRGRQVHGEDARALGLWIRRWANLDPRVPLSYHAHARIRSWVSGRRAIRVEEWAKIYDYIVRKRLEAKQRTSVQLTIRVGGGGMG